jgi:N-acetylmuramoyl-L-alanine amidase
MILEGLLWMTLNVYHEARGEEQSAQIAVAHATINRAHKRGLSIKDTVTQPRQYSWTYQLKDYWPKDPKAFVQCLQSVYIAAQGVDLTDGATYYHAESITPYWAKEYTLTAQWGAHKFYRSE